MTVLSHFISFNLTHCLHWFGLVGFVIRWRLLHNENLKQNEAQSARAESTHKGVN